MQGTYTLSIIKRINPYILFFLFSLGLYLPASFIRSPLPPDEIRSIHVAQNITTFKTFLIPTYLGEAYYDKPPLYFWILKAFLRISQFNYLFFPTLFNVLISGMILSVNYAVFKRKGVEKIGIYSSFFLATTVIFYGLSVLLRMDILFLFFIFLSVFYFWKNQEDNKIRYLILSGAFSFLAVFTKGALGIVFPFFIEAAGSLLAKDKKAAVKTLAVNASVVAACFLWISSFTKIDPQYFQKMVLDQTLSRGFGQERHSFLRVRNALFYLPFLFLLFLPWSFLGIGYFSNLRRKKIDFWEKVYLWWFWGGFVILSLLRSKMEMYLLLLAIPFCGLTAKFFVEAKDEIKRKIFYVTSGFFAFVVMGGWIYCKTAGEYIPAFASSILFVFLAGFIFIIKKPLRAQFRNFSISWILFLQIANLLALPLVAEHSELKKIVEKVNSLGIPADKIYSREQSHLLLPAYENFKKEIVYWEKETCPPDSCILISLYEATQCRGNEIASVGVNHFYYNKK